MGALWLLPGYIFGTDWSGPRHFSGPDQLWSGAGWQAALGGTSALLGAEFATKLLILGSLFLAALTAYNALPVGGFVPRAMAASIYTVNPFVYGRIHYGQLTLFAAYALMPWFAIELRKLVLDPKPRATILSAISLTIIGILDLHFLLPTGLLAIVAGSVFAFGRLRSGRYLVRLAAAGLGASGLTVFASAYWLIPLLAGTNPQGREVAGFSGIDLQVFRTVPDSTFGLIPNVLGLYGFWAENVSRFPSMKEFVPFWPLVLGALLTLAVVGVVASLWRPDVNFDGARPWVATLVAAGALAVMLDLGVSEQHIAPLIQWLDSTFPPYRGMRDAGKWAALLALVYAQLVPLGSMVIMAWLRRNKLPGPGEMLPVFAAGLLLALPVYYGNGLLFGMHGEVRPSMYPAGWYAADRTLLSDPLPDKTLFLPWHLYLKLGFVRNTNAVIATPAPSFFSVPVLVSADPEVSGLRPANTPEQGLVTRLISAHGDADWAQALATIHIKYVLLAREVDWRSYQYLDHQPGLAMVADYGSIVLYRNLSWRGP